MVKETAAKSLEMYHVSKGLLVQNEMAPPINKNMYYAEFKVILEEQEIEVSPGFFITLSKERTIIVRSWANINPNVVSYLEKMKRLLPISLDTAPAATMAKIFDWSDLLSNIKSYGSIFEITFRKVSNKTPEDHTFEYD